MAPTVRSVGERDRVSDPNGQRADDPFLVLDQLPHRQREIVAALLQGERISAIAAAQFVSPSTVRSHLSSIFEAFGVHSQTELLAVLGSGRSSSAGAERLER